MNYTVECIKCGHDLKKHCIHQMSPVGVHEKFTYMIRCEAQGDNYTDTCDCNGGFEREITVKVEYVEK